MAQTKQQCSQVMSKVRLPHSSYTYVCVLICACVCVCVRACVRACARASAIGMRYRQSPYGLVKCCANALPPVCQNTTRVDEIGKS